MRRLAQTVALLAAGAAAYYAAPVAIRLARPASAPAPPLVAVTETPPGLAAVPADRSGDVVLVNCLAELERRGSVEAELVQSGRVLGQPVELGGVYRQSGRGFGRKFATLLQGRIAGSPARLWQVSTGLFLYTDLAWTPTGEPQHRRAVTRVDLRRIQRELTIGPGSAADPLAKGQAAAQSIDPTVSAAFGGLPMLIESLGANFHFSAPRKMGLHNQPVFVLVGRWRPTSLAALAPADAAGTGGAADRLPDHVLLALGAGDLFPYLIEYRSAADPLASPALTDNDRLQQSPRPLLRMEFRRPRFGDGLADTHFAYPEAGSVDRRDITAERLATLRKRQKLKIAARHGPPGARFDRR